jgi:hypothetical protein
MGVSGQRHASAALYPRGKDPRYPLDRGLGGPRVHFINVQVLATVGDTAKKKTEKSIQKTGHGGVRRQGWFSLLLFTFHNNTSYITPHKCALIEKCAPVRCVHGFQIISVKFFILHNPLIYYNSTDTTLHWSLNWLFVVSHKLFIIMKCIYKCHKGTHVLRCTTSARRPAVLTEVLHGSPQFLQISGQYLKLGHNCFLLHSFQLIIH